jgi:hypothetical protein
MGFQKLGAQHVEHMKAPVCEARQTGQTSDCQAAVLWSSNTNQEDFPVPARSHVERRRLKGKTN